MAADFDIFLMVLFSTQHAEKSDQHYLVLKEPLGEELLGVDRLASLLRLKVPHDLVDAQRMCIYY